LSSGTEHKDELLSRRCASPQLTVRDAIPKARELATAEFATLRLRLLKIAARVVETATRIRLAFAAACPEADLIHGLPGALLPLGP
jgi:hypothetical protein